MTDKQKEAVLLIGRLMKEKKINDEEYMLLMENVLEDRFVCFPTHPTYPSITPDGIYEPKHEPVSTTTTDGNLYPHKEYQG